MAAQRIYALFQDVADAERAIGALEDHGVPRAGIGVAARRPAEADEAGRVRAGFTRVTDGQDQAQESRSLPMRPSRGRCRRRPLPPPPRR